MATSKKSNASLLKDLTFIDYVVIAFFIALPVFVGYILADTAGAILGIVLIPLLYIVCIIRNLRKGIKVPLLFKESFADLVMFCGKFSIFVP